VGFLEFGHVDSNEIALAAIEKIGESERGFGFADAAGTDEHKDADGLDGIVHASAIRGNTLSNGFQGVVLADDADGHQIFEMEYGIDFVLLHFADGDAGPCGDDFADDLRVHAHAHEGRIALESVELGIEFF